MGTLGQGKREELIGKICAALHDTKSYELPDLCVSIGLAEGDSSEAHSSKRLYVRSRVQHLTNDQLIKVAEVVDDRVANFELSEFIRKMKESEVGPGLSDLTRRALVNELERVELFGELHLVTELSKLWPISRMAGPYLGKTLEESIYQHCIRNPEDWGNSYLLDQLDIIGCSRALFFMFLEAVVSPNARRGEEQKKLIEQMNHHLQLDGYQLQMTGSISGYPVYKVLSMSGGVSGAPKNLIFAAIGAKPEIVLSDAINNDISIVKHAENCLIYDRPIGSEGLSKADMIEWWKCREGLADEKEARRFLYERLSASLDSDGEKNLFNTYYGAFKSVGGRLPALIPQVYLHYDPYTIRQLGGVGRLIRQRMDFLMLFSSSVRVVIEVDGSQHFAEGGKPSLKKYAEMVSADRDLRLAGYEIYRFGSNELVGSHATTRITSFFEKLLKKHAG